MPAQAAGRIGDVASSGGGAGAPVPMVDEVVRWYQLAWP